MSDVTNTPKRLTKKEASKYFMSNDQVQEFFQKLQYAATKKNLYFYFKKSQDLENILKILQKAHFIAGYTKHGLENFKIFLKFDMHGVCVIKETKIVVKCSKKVIINSRNVRAFLNDYPYTLAFIRTKYYGILNIKDCWENYIGGEFIAYVK